MGFDTSPKINLWGEKEFIIHILSRLPAKSVLRFRSVCKLWALIIQDDAFIAEHAKNRKNQGVPGIMCINSFNFSPPTLEYFTDSYHRHVKRSILCPHDVSLVSNSCNGLVCVYGSSPKNTGVFIVNPTVDDGFLELPKEKRATIKYDKFIGLGYDRILNKYKVVTLYSHHDKTLGCELLTIGDARWRQLGEALPFKIVRHQTPVFVNGNIHWKVETKEGETGLTILCFDMIHETFDTIVHPECSSISDDLVEYEGCLSIYRHCADSCRSFLIVLRDYINGTGINQRTIDLTPIKNSSVSTGTGKNEENEIECIGIHKGKLVFCNSNSLVYHYSVGTRMFEKCTKLRTGPISLGIVASYSESLISASRICKR